MSEPLRLDFLSADWLRRIRSGGKKQALARAVGFPGPAPDVLDATAGFARDALFLASLGCKVIALERSPLVFSAVQDALNRASKRQEIEKLLKENLEYRLGDSREFLSNPENRKSFDVVYLDPMYPEKRKAALPKQELQLLRELVGKDEDAAKLFELALAARPKRVVVKRPLHAPPFSEKVTHSFASKLARFDMYLR